MGLLSKLLTLPVSGPLSGLRFVAEQLTEAAIKEEFDPDAIKRAIVALEARLEAGEIDEEAYEAEEQVLLERLREARRLQAGAA